MSNTHGIPDTLKELEAIRYDLLPACIIGISGLTTPGSGLSMPNLSVIGYVRRGTDLLYVNQPPATVTVSSTAGNHWLALTADTWTTIAGWTRMAGSHYVEQANATQPTAPDGAQLVAQVTVTGGNITAVSALAALPLSRQNASAVAITGGSITGLSALRVTGTTGRSDLQADTGIIVPNYTPSGGDPIAFLGQVTAGTGRWNLYMGGTAANYCDGPLSLGNPSPPSNIRLYVQFAKNATYGAKFQQTVNDTGPTQPILFTNVAGTDVGSISTNATSTAYNTSSDRRLKDAITPLTDALATVVALTPVQFLWKADGTPGHGFLADEVQQVVPEAVTGEPEALQPDGTIAPMGMDASKLVPWLVGAVQELAGQVAALTARLEAAGG